MELKNRGSQKVRLAAITALGTLLLHGVVIFNVGIYGGLNSSANSGANIPGPVYAQLIPSGNHEPACINNCANTNFDAAEAIPETSIYPSETAKRKARGTDFKSVFPDSGLGLSHYYDKSELTSQPQILIDPRIVFPEDDDARIIGTIKIRLLLSELGNVDEVQVVDKTMPENYVILILEAFKKTVFKPGELHGKTVKSQLQFEVNFQRDIVRQDL